MKNLSIMMIGFVVLGAFASANAEDFAPPSWAGQALTVWADWDYPNTPMPADLNNAATAWGNAGTGPNGEVLSTAVSYQGAVWPVAAVETLNDFQAGPGGWTSMTNNATLHYNVPNYIDMEPFKYVRVEVTYVDPLNTGLSPYVKWIEFFDPTIPGNMDSFSPSEGQAVTTVFEMPALPDMHGKVYEDWILVPNPDWEIISLSVPAGIILQETFIHTISVPEPASLTLLALGGLALIRRRRA